MGGLPSFTPWQEGAPGAGEQHRHAWPTTSSWPGPLRCPCKWRECLQASSDPAPCHPCKPVWLADWEGGHQDQGDQRGEGRGGLKGRAGLTASYPLGSYEPGSSALGYGSSRKWPPFFAHRLQVPRCRWQGTCSPTPQSVPSPCPGCLMPSSCVCARSVLSSWRWVWGQGERAEAGPWGCLVRPPKPMSVAPGGGRAGLQGWM